MEPALISNNMDVNGGATSPAVRKFEPKNTSPQPHPRSATLGRESSIDQVLLEGWLEKKGQILGSKKCFFRLTETRLKSMGKEDAKTGDGSIKPGAVLSSSDGLDVSQIQSVRPVKVTSFEIITKSKTYILSTTDSKERDRWVTRLQDAMVLASRRSSVSSQTPNPKPTSRPNSGSATLPGHNKQLKPNGTLPPQASLEDPFFVDAQGGLCMQKGDKADGEKNPDAKKPKGLLPKIGLPKAGLPKAFLPKTLGKTGKDEKKIENNDEPIHIKGESMYEEARVSAITSPSKSPFQGGPPGLNGEYAQVEAPSFTSSSYSAETDCDNIGDVPNKGGEDCEYSEPIEHGTKSPVAYPRKITIVKESQDLGASKETAMNKPKLGPAPVAPKSKVKAGWAKPHHNYEDVPEPGKESKPRSELGCSGGYEEVQIMQRDAKEMSTLEEGKEMVKVGSSPKFEEIPDMKETGVGQDLRVSSGSGSSVSYAEIQKSGGNNNNPPNTESVVGAGDVELKQGQQQQQKQQLQQQQQQQQQQSQQQQQHQQKQPIQLDLKHQQSIESRLAAETASRNIDRESTVSIESITSDWGYISKSEIQRVNDIPEVPEVPEGFENDASGSAVVSGKMINTSSSSIGNFEHYENSDKSSGTGGFVRNESVDKSSSDGGVLKLGSSEGNIGICSGDGFNYSGGGFNYSGGGFNNSGGGFNSSGGGSVTQIKVECYDDEDEDQMYDNPMQVNGARVAPSLPKRIQPADEVDDDEPLYDDPVAVNTIKIDNQPVHKFDNQIEDNIGNQTDNKFSNQIDNTTGNQIENKTGNQKDNKNGNEEASSNTTDITSVSKFAPPRSFENEQEDEEEALYGNIPSTFKTGNFNDNIKINDPNKTGTVRAPVATPRTNKGGSDRSSGGTSSDASSRTSQEGSETDSKQKTNSDDTKMTPKPKPGPPATKPKPPPPVKSKKPVDETKVTQPTNTVMSPRPPPPALPGPGSFSPPAPKSISSNFPVSTSKNDTLAAGAKVQEENQTQNSSFSNKENLNSQGGCSDSISDRRPPSHIPPPPPNTVKTPISSITNTKMETPAVDTIELKLKSDQNMMENISDSKNNCENKVETQCENPLYGRYEPAANQNSGNICNDNTMNSIGSSKVTNGGNEENFKESRIVSSNEVIVGEKSNIRPTSRVGNSGELEEEEIIIPPPEFHFQQPDSSEAAPSPLIKSPLSQVISPISPIVSPISPSPLASPPTLVSQSPLSPTSPSISKSPLESPSPLSPTSPKSPPPAVKRRVPPTPPILNQTKNISEAQRDAPGVTAAQAAFSASAASNAPSASSTSSAPAVSGASAFNKLRDFMADEPGASRPGPQGESNKPQAMSALKQYLASLNQ